MLWKKKKKKVLKREITTFFIHPKKSRAGTQQQKTRHKHKHKHMKNVILLITYTLIQKKEVVFI